MNIVNELQSNMYVQLARRNLTRQTVRTLLAAIGIIIGVIAISSMGILGNSLKLSVSDSIGDIGDTLIVGPAPGEDVITEKQVEQMRKVSGIELIIPVLQSGDKIDYRGGSTFGSTYSLEKEDLQELVEIEHGRFFRPGSTDCVVGSQIATSLELGVGSKIEISDSRMRVVGILKERGLGFDISTDTGVFMSSQMYEKLYPDEDDGYDSIIITVTELDKINEVKTSIEERLNKREEVVNVFAMNTITEGIDEVFRSLSLFLMGIGSISLLVAGVSILNVMLMSTMERTKEIGVMKAVGASRNDILWMFLLEALFLGVGASLIGGVLSFGGGFLVNYLILDDVSYLLAPTNLLYISAGIVFGIITSLIGGMYPAWKASQMRPLDALRHE
ncbi:MAG: ABC transporter permease [Methanosarcinaceae archaeon]|nr:ABC transporter permease [Methanosarcinaceae archaeon]